MKKIMIGSTVEAKGFYGHKGRPGKRGGSQPKATGPSPISKAVDSWVRAFYNINQKYHKKKYGKKWGVSLSQFAKSPTPYLISSSSPRYSRRQK